MKKHILIYTLTVLFLVILLPWGCVAIFNKVILPPAVKQSIPQNNMPKTVSLYLSKEHRTVTLNFEDYITGVVAAEMPATFHREALKAQAVAARTYAFGKIRGGSKLCDTTHCQVYRSSHISSKVRQAVKATAGKILYYKNKPAKHALYFSSSGGETANSEDVFTTPIPYLTCVKSPYESRATHRNEKYKLSVSALSAKLKAAYPSKAFGTVNGKNIRILTRSDGGRIKTIKVGRVLLTGQEFRMGLNLYSAKANLYNDGSKVIIKTSGAGHGVGMSQYGADGFARHGWGYKKILCHFYKGCNVK